MKLGVWMSDKAPVWDAMVKRHGLMEKSMDEVVTWGFGDFCWNLEHDVVSSVAKLRLAGFHDTIDTEAQILAQLARYRAEKVLP
jgi:hypothetical protein